MENHNLVRSVQSDKAIGVNFWTGAATPHFEIPTKANNPSFKRIVLDRETFVPVRVETYYLDLLNNKTSFEFGHEYTEYY